MPVPDIGPLPVTVPAPPTNLNYQAKVEWENCWFPMVDFLKTIRPHGRFAIFQEPALPTHARLKME